MTRMMSKYDVNAMKPKNNMEDTINIQITIGEHTIERNYGIIDGQPPDNMQEIVQEMTETLLDKSEL